MICSPATPTTERTGEYNECFANIRSCPVVVISAHRPVGRAFVDYESPVRNGIGIHSVTLLCTTGIIRNGDLLVLPKKADKAYELGKYALQNAHKQAKTQVQLQTVYYF